MLIVGPVQVTGRKNCYECEGKPAFCMRLEKLGDASRGPV